MSDKQGNGVVFEVGIGYRMTVQQIKEYQLKEGKKVYGF